MPSTDTLELLVRNTPLKEPDWLMLVEARRALIKPHLDSFTLPELGALECLEIGSHRHEIRLGGPEVTGNPDFSLKTQGIFDAPYSGRVSIPGSGYQNPGGSCPDGSLQIWGLTRKGLWILAEVFFHGEAGYKDRGYERAHTVNIKEADLPTILAKTKQQPRHLWNRLADAVHGWVRAREGLYRQAQHIQRTIQLEQFVLEQVPETESSV